jgi:CMP/dCMP kinase
VYFDTGILYRALTHIALERGIDPSDSPALAACARSMDVRISRASVDDGRQCDVILDGRDVTHLLRTPAVDRSVSEVSAHSEVREALLVQQREIGRSGVVVMVGRDIGTVVLPEAELKVFLDASPEERARRRCEQLATTGRPVPYGEVLEDMRRRDAIDSQRDIAPLRPAADAVVIDSDRLSIDAVASQIIDEAQHRLSAVGTR